MNSKTGFTPLQGPGLALQQCVDRFCALVLRTKLIIFPLFEVKQSLQLHQSMHELSLKIPSLLVYAGI